MTGSRQQVEVVDEAADTGVTVVGEDIVVVTAVDTVEVIAEDIIVVGTVAEIGVVSITICYHLQRLIERLFIFRIPGSWRMARGRR